MQLVLLGHFDLVVVVLVSPGLTVSSIHLPVCESCLCLLSDKQVRLVLRVLQVTVRVHVVVRSMSYIDLADGQRLLHCSYKPPRLMSGKRAAAPSYESTRLLSDREAGFPRFCLRRTVRNWIARNY